jgi:hypothetical protein
MILLLMILSYWWFGCFKWMVFWVSSISIKSGRFPVPDAFGDRNVAAPVFLNDSVVK